MPHILPLRTLDDMDANTIEKTTPDGINFARIYVPNDVKSIEMLAELTPRYCSQKRQGLAVSAGWGSFTGVTDYAAAVKLYRNGWKEGESKAKEIIDRLTIQTRIKAPKMVQRPCIAPVGGLSLNWTDIAQDGFKPFVGSFKSDTEKTGRKLVRIGVNVGVSSRVSHDVIVARGAMATALVIMLERAKIACTLDALDGFGKVLNDPNGAVITTMRVKDAGAAINVAKMIYVLAHPAAHRRIMFSIYDHAPMKFANYGSYGYPVVMAKCKEITSPYQIFMDSETAEDEFLWTNPAKQEIWIKDMLKKQGVLCS